MIANFFQSLSDRSVEYLLISGQATVLYGAATFSEDIDLWINPASENRDRFTATLRDCRARFYKLTPQLTSENLSHGHGFHFVLPGGKESDVFPLQRRVASNLRLDSLAARFNSVHSTDLTLKSR